MNATFADTSFYAALLNRRDQYHTRATAAAAKITGSIVTSEFVLVETANFCLDEKRRAAYLRLIARLRAAKDVEIIPAGPNWFQKGLELFSERPDKQWSLTDCISFVLMNERKIEDALTADQNFEQAGFVVLLK